MLFNMVGGGSGSINDEEVNKLPVLDSAYPADVSFLESDGRSATFKVEIAEEGIPASYTYQWYQDGSAVLGATSPTYTTSILSSVETHSVYCEVTNEAGTVTSRVATLTVQSSKPSYTFSGTHELIDDGNHNWRIKLKSTGTLRLSHLGKGAGAIEVFLVGGGGGGGDGGGAGGKTTTSNATMTINTDYPIIVGAGGSGSGERGGDAGGTSSAFGKTADGGSGGDYWDYAAGHMGSGGTGGSGGGSYGGNQAGGNGGSDGSDGYGGYYPDENGSGQGVSTYEFGASSGTLYAGGGGGSGALWVSDEDPSNYAGGSGGAGGGGKGGKPAIHQYDNQWAGDPGATNTGGGGGGGAQGGSGIVIIRNKR